MEHTSEQLAEKFMSLPQEVQAAIWDLDLDGAIGEIGLNHKLHLDQIGALADQTALVLIGINPIADYEKNLTQALPSVAGVDIRAIVNEVNQEIFLPIRESLQKVGEGKPATTQELTAQPIKAPTIFETKMAKLFRIPREEVDLNHGGGGSGNGSALAPNTNPPPTTDPYRELTN